MLQISKDQIQQLYVNSVFNRLRALKAANKDVQKRWVWELIQNAKDCLKEAKSYIPSTSDIPFSKSYQSVDIKIIYDKSEQILIFKHNGFPFTQRTLDSLMYTLSSKKSKEDSTGRFGTGFMTSHTLSRVVPISGPFISYKTGELKMSYIKAVIYREGTTEKQLGQEFLKMENSKKEIAYNPNNEEHKWTTYTYKLSTDLAIQSAELGIQSFRDNIVEVLMFCNEINSTQLNDENPITLSSISKSKNLTIDQNVFSSIQIMEKTVNYSKKRKFIVASVEEPNEQFSKKYANDYDKDYELKKLKLTIAFEINKNYKMVDFKQDQICLFCTFPLIGSQKYQLPYLLHCHSFETTTEREGIILGEEEFEENNILSNSGLNTLIINYSIKLFKIIVQWQIEQNKFSNFASFSNGLVNDAIYDAETLKLMKPFLDNLRSVLEDSKIVQNSENVPTMLKDVIILDFKGVKNRESFHDLASELYSNVASFDNCKQWQGKTWGKISVLNIDTFINHIHHIGQNVPFNPTGSFSSFQLSGKFLTSVTSKLGNRDFAFLNELYNFLLNEETEESENVKINDDSIFYKYRIIFNSDNKFTILRNLKSDSKSSKDFKQIMELCPAWKSKIIHPKIKAFKNLVPKVTINDAIQEINSVLEEEKGNIEFLLSFTRFVLDKNEYRMKMYQVAKLFYENVPDQIVLRDVDEKLWSSTDSLLLDQIKQEIDKDKGKKFTKSLETLNIFYELYQKFSSNDNFLVPNFNLILTERKKLGFISNEIDKKLLNTLGCFMKLSQYAHPSITTVSFQSTYNLDNLIQTINSDDFFRSKNGIIMDDHFLSVLSIMPPKSNQRLFNYQTSIRELAKLFFCKEIESIPTNIVNELFWKKANEIVLDSIEDNLTQHGNIQTLSELLEKNEEIIFDNLNMYYELLTTDNSNRQDKAMVPNYKGSFLPAKQISISKGVSEELFELYNVIQQESDIREKYAHPNVKCNFLRIIDFKQFISSICEGLSDKQLIEDNEILQAISKLNIAQPNNASHNENDILLQKLYVANIKNRLNEIQNPKENDKMRWPWELIQNAKDSLFSPSNTKDQKKVEIRIEITKDKKTHKCTEIRFRHDGPPFTDDSFIGLLYKISQGKDNSKTTGRFGTGFISTHVLSKVVRINVNRINKDGKVYGFTATMYREGTNDPDIIEDFKKMQKSQRVIEHLWQYNEFVYNISSEESQECVMLGLNHLKAHIAPALINCHEIDQVVLVEDDVETKYYIKKEKKLKIQNIKYSLYHILAGDETIKMIYLRNKDKDLNISIEVKDKNIVKIDDKNESIFVSLPLVGSYRHALPFYLNSPKFEPVTERNALYLEDKEKINGKLTNTGTNRLFLMKSVDLFRNLIIILNSTHCQNIYELSRGLNLTQLLFADFEWYQSVFLKEMREILANNAFVNTANGKTVLLKDAYFPSKNIKDKNLEQFIEIASRYCKFIVSFDDAMIWKKRAWDKLNIVEIDGLVYEVEADKSLFDEPEYDYLNKFLGFVKKIDINILYQNCLIPDMNNELHCLDKEVEKFDFKESKTVKGQIIDIMESIGINWKSTHMNYKINSISLSEDKMIDAENRIVEKTKEENEMCFELMKYVLEGDEFRENMFYFVTKLKLRNFEAIPVSNINPDIWIFADKFVIKYIVELIQSFQPNQVEPLMEFFIRFLPLYKSYQKDENEFNSTKIFPNAKYALQSLTKLRNKDKSFHDHLNPIMIQYFGKDLDDDIIHPDLDQIIKAKFDESLSEVIYTINKKIKDFEKDVQLIIAEKIVQLIPQEKVSFYVSTKIPEPSSKQIIFNLYRDLINHELSEVFIASRFSSDSQWIKTNNIIIEHICSRIEEIGNLNNFKETYGINNDNKCFRILNDLYKFASDFVDKYKIIPNQQGVFKLISELKEDPGIKGDLLECINYLNPESLAKYEFADGRVKVNNLKKINIMVFYRDLNQMFTEALKKPDVDEKVIEMIKQINHIDDSFLDIVTSKKLDDDQKARVTILQNAHVQFISNRLRELNTPKMKDFKRWPFELIQNANDSLFTSKAKQHVDNNDNDNKEFEVQQKVKIEFEFEKDKVVFRHNGPAFTNESLFALLYQCSEGKGKDSRTTGKFGTGFLSTHILSKIVNFSGDVYAKDGTTSGFSVTIYRDGVTNDDLKNGVKKMEESLEKGLDDFNWTSFEYVLPKDQKSRKAYDEGLKSLKNNIGPVLIYNPTIESISIKTEKDTLVYTANHEEGNIQTISITNPLTSSKHQNHLTNKFIYFSNNVEFDESNNIEINCLLPINSSNEIVKTNGDVLFISYPLFDDDQFYSPILINSKRFEPEKERNTILIQAEETPDESKESLINKFIFVNTVDLFKQIVSFALKLNCTKFYNLCPGLKTEDKTPQFLQEEFYGKMREILLNFPVFETPAGLRTVNEVLLPSISTYEIFSDYDKNDKQPYNKRRKHFKKFYSLVSQVSIESKLVVDYDCCLQWLYSSWLSFPSKIEIESFIEFISSHQKVSDLKLIMNIDIDDDDENDNDNNNNNNNNNNDNNNNNNDDDDDDKKDDDDAKYISLNLNKSIRGEPKVKFVKKLIVFIEQMKDCARLFKENKLLINAKGDFVSSDDIHHFHLPKTLVDMLDIVEYDYREKTLHSDIHHLYNNTMLTFEKFEFKQAIEHIKENINKMNAISFMKYVIEDDDKRSSMFEYTKFFLDDSIESVQVPKSEEYIDDLKEMLRQADNLIIPQIIPKLSSLDIEHNLQFFINLFNFLKSILSYQDFSSLHIYPNQRYVLCPSHHLSIDGIDDDNVKDVLQRVLNIDLRSRFLLDDFAHTVRIGSTTKSVMSQILLRHLQSMNFNDLEENKKFEFYSIIFKYSASNENKERIQQIMSVLHFFLQFDVVDVDEHSEDKWSNDLLNTVIEYAAIDVSNYITRFTTTEQLQEDIEYEEKDNEFAKLTYDNLSYLYNFTTDRKIFPTLTKEFVALENVHWLHDQQLDEEMMDKLLDYMIEFEQSDEIKQHILSDSITVHEKLKGMIHAYDLNYLAQRIIDNISEREDKESKEFQQLFISFLKFVNSSNELKIIFNQLIEGEMKDKMEDFIDYLENSQEEKECGYTGEALVYEALVESGKFSVIEWIAKSNSKTDFFVTLQNGNKYYIEERCDPYDIYVEDPKGRKYFIEVKSTKAGKDNKKFSFNLSPNQFAFASEISDPKSHFVLAIVKDVLKSPQILFLTRQNEVFTL